MARAGKNEHWVGFDLGGTKMLALVLDRNFKVLGSRKRKTKAQDGMGVGLERIQRTITDALADAGITPNQLNGIGVGSPGPLDLKKGMILESPNLGWADTPLKASLEKAFKCPTTVSNDVDAGTYGEVCFGAARGTRCAVGIFPGTGIGGGCVYEDTLITGKTHSCLEIGHVKVVPNGELCGCGARGCLETVASRLAIASACATAAFRGQAPALLAAVGTDMGAIRSGVLAAAIRDGDAVIEQIIRRAARWLGCGSATLVNLFAPDVVVLGGGLVEAMPKLFLEEVTQAAREQAMPSLETVFTVKIAALGDDATAKGAAAWARRAQSARA